MTPTVKDIQQFYKNMLNRDLSIEEAKTILGISDEHDERPDAVTHGDMPAVLRSLVRTFVPVSKIHNVVKMSCASCHADSTMHRVTEGTLNDESGWYECECSTCADSTVWHIASNYQTKRYVKEHK